MPQELNFNFFNILIISGTIQGLIFGFVVLLNNRYKSTSNKYLAQVVIYLSLSNLYYWLIDTNISKSFKYYEYFYVPWSLLVLPMYYFFVVTYLKYDLNKKTIFYLKLPFVISLTIHFLFLFHILFLTPYFEVPKEIKWIFFGIEEYFYIVFTLGLIFMTFKVIRKYEIENRLFSFTNVSIKTKWLKQLLYFGILICVFWLILLLLSNFKNRVLFDSGSRYFLWVSMSVLIYWLGYLGIYHSGVFTQRQQIRTSNLENFNSNSKIKPGLNITRFEEIDSHIKNNKMYLNPNISLDILADHFGLSKGYISQLVNEFSNTNFSNYINHLRIEESKKMLLNKEYSNYTIVAIALEAGFNSKSAFYSAFKRETGFSPNGFKQKNLS